MRLSSSYHSFAVSLKPGLGPELHLHPASELSGLPCLAKASYCLLVSFMSLWSDVGSSISCYLGSRGPCASAFGVYTSHTAAERLKFRTVALKLVCASVWHFFQDVSRLLHDPGTIRASARSWWPGWQETCENWVLQGFDSLLEQALDLCDQVHAGAPNSKINTHSPAPEARLAHHNLQIRSIAPACRDGRQPVSAAAILFHQTLFRG